MGRLAHHELDGEMEVRDLLEIALEHGAIAGEAERPPVVARVVGDEPVQVSPILPVEAGDIGSIEIGEGGGGHRRRSLRSNAQGGLRSCPGKAIGRPCPPKSTH